MTDVEVRSSAGAVEVYVGSEAERLNGPGMFLNASPFGRDDIVSALRPLAPVVAALVQWTVESKQPSRRGSLLDRDRFLSPRTTFEQIALARDALDDDVVGSTTDITEALAFADVGVFSHDEDEQDALNQWAADIDLDTVLRQQWELLISDSQFVPVMWWGTETYQVRGTTGAGNARRTKFTWQVPTAVGHLDTVKVTPIGSLVFGRERLAYIADRDEAQRFDDILGLRNERLKRRRALAVTTHQTTRGATGDAPVTLALEEDPVVAALMMGRYLPPEGERRQLAQDGVETANLFTLNPQMAWRHTLTRPPHRRFARVRMKSINELLDLKAQLHQMDRSFLIGGTNYIVLITKGSDAKEAEPEEIRELQASAQVIASVPIIVGDHRLKVEIITPKLDMTLDEKKYDVLDDRIRGRLLLTFPDAKDDSLKLGQLIGRGLESRRKMVKRAWERNVLRAIRRRNGLESLPKIIFRPSSIQLAFDQARASFILDMRASGDASRETALGVVDLDQADEAVRREREREKYDDIFLTQQPYGAPNPANPAAKPVAPGQPAPGSPAGKRTAGRTQGGRRRGGGAAPGTGQGQSPRNPRKVLRSRKELLERAKHYEIKGRWGLLREDLAALVAEYEENDPELAHEHDDDEETDDDE